MTSRTLCVFFLALLSLRAATVAEMRRAFVNPPDDSRIMMRWWWFGPSVTKAEIARELKVMKEGGIGGVEVQPVYPLALDDAAAGIRNLPYLSDEFIDSLRFAAEEARRLGLRLDVTLGSGWPYGGPHIPVSRAAGKLRWERVRVGDSRRVPVPAIADGEKLLAAFAVSAGGAYRKLDGIREGVLELPAEGEQPQSVLFFIDSRTGQMVKRPSVGAEGFVLDHYDRAAIDIHLKQVADRLMQAFGPQPPYAVFCDSLEVFGSDWTSDLPSEFRKRRGYDLEPFLPALVMDIGEKTAGVRHDYGRTLTELVEERFLAPLRDWAKQNRTLFRIQNYGTPPAALSSYRYSDLPEGEGAQWKSLSSSRWASSAGHLYGHAVTSSETWTWLHSPSFRATPLDMKAEADLHFLQGVNQLIGHGWPYTAEGVGYPGWRLYAAGAFNDRNPWWGAMPGLSLYLQRLSYLLRQGRPVNDVAIYLSNSDGWASLSAGRASLIDALRNRIGPDVVARVLEAGYGFDFIDDGTIGKLASGGYRIVVLPNVELIPAATLRKLAEFAKGGGAVIATRRLPAGAPGLMASEAERNEVRETSRALFAGAGRFVADEHGGLAAALNKALPPDVSFSQAVPALGFIHRSADSAEIYFIANTGNLQQRVEAVFRSPGLEPELWNPLTGRVEAASVRNRSDAGVTVALDLEPYGSRVLVFSKEQARHQDAVRESAPLDLSAGWTVRFGSKMVGMDSLRSWTENEDTRYYSGEAVYERDVQVPQDLLERAAELRLDFGEGRPIPETRTRNGMRTWFEAPVRDAAVVYVNGERAGSVWCPPYALDLKKFLRPGANRLKIVVGNTAINHLAGRRLPDYRLLNARYGVRFEPQDMENLQPLPSGLLGPIRLIPIGGLWR